MPYLRPHKTEQLGWFAAQKNETACIATRYCVLLWNCVKILSRNFSKHVLNKIVIHKLKHFLNMKSAITRYFTVGKYYLSIVKTRSSILIHISHKCKFQTISELVSAGYVKWIRYIPKTERKVSLRCRRVFEMPCVFIVMCSWLPRNFQVWRGL